MEPDHKVKVPARAEAKGLVAGERGKAKGPAEVAAAGKDADKDVAKEAARDRAKAVNSRSEGSPPRNRSQGTAAGFRGADDIAVPSERFRREDGPVLFGRNRRLLMFGE